MDGDTEEIVKEDFAAPNLFAAASLSALAALPAAILLMIPLLLFGSKLDHVAWTTMLVMLGLVPVAAFAGVLIYALPIILALNYFERLTPTALGITAAAAGPVASLILWDWSLQLMVVVTYHALVVAAAFWQVINRMPKRRRPSSAYLTPF